MRTPCLDDPGAWIAVLIGAGALALGLGEALSAGDMEMTNRPELQQGWALLDERLRQPEPVTVDDPAFKDAVGSITSNLLSLNGVVASAVNYYDFSSLSSRACSHRVLRASRSLHASLRCATHHSKEIPMKQSSSASQKSLAITTRSFVSMLSEEVAGKLKTFHMHDCMHATQCLMRPEDHGTSGVNPPIIPYAQMKRSRVYTGTRETGSYNHHSQLAWFKGKYHFAWSNGVVHEEDKGQRIMISSSADAKNWSDAATVVGDWKDPVIAQNCVAIRATDDKLFIFGKKEDTIRDAASVGMRRIDPQNQRIFLHASSDGVRWEQVGALSDRIIWIFESPRQTADGSWLSVATLKEGAAMLRWKTNDFTRDAEVIPVLQPFGARFPYGEGSWYQTTDGTIVVFWRDEGMSCRLWVNYSTDGGKSFSEPTISDIPDSMSRVYAGKLGDGRYYISNNAFPTLLNRMHLMLLVSENGYQFTSVSLLVDDPVAQRLVGMLKCNGYQYPCCLPEKDKLLVGYSVNKEDIECGVVELANV